VLTNQLFINGKPEDPVCGRRVDVINPATGELVTTVPDADAGDVDRAVAAARASFENESWHGMDPSKRERILGSGVTRTEAGGWLDL
jgi:acyl-CoA reductase-like NAD-dependent aldehyde dehydrogenase